MGDAAEVLTPDAPETAEASPEETTAPAEVSAEGGESPAEGEAVPAKEAESQAEEKPAEEPPKERETAIFRKALRMKEEAVQARERAEHVLSEVRKEREEARKDREEASQLLKMKEEIDADPWKFFELFKVSVHDHARRMMDESDPAAKRIADLERQVREREEREKARQREYEDRDIDARVQASKSNFARFVGERFDDYPDIADEDASEVSDVFWELATEHHRNTGHIPTFEMVATYMQQQAAQKRATREQRRLQRSGAARVTPATSENPSGGQTATPRASGPSETGPGPRAPSTLTNSAATTRTSIPRKDATEEEIDAWAVEELRRAFRKDADS